MSVTTFPAGSGRLSYLRRGDGPPVVCVPGGPGFDPAAYYAGLTLEGHELIVLAPRGTGASTPPPAPADYRLAGYVDDLEALRDHLGLETMTVLGHSHGGSVALAHAIAHPERVGRLVLIGAPTGIDDAFRRAVADARARFAAAISDGAQRLAASDAAGAQLPTAGSDERRRELLFTVLSRHVARLGDTETAFLQGICSAPLNPEAARVTFAELGGGLDLMTDAAQVRAPALVVSGEYDVVVPPEVTRRLAQALPGGDYVELAAAGHFVETEAPDAFAEAVTGFLSAVV